MILKKWGNLFFAIKSFSILLLLLCLASCKQGTTSNILTLVEIPTASKSSGEPNLFVSNTNEVYLSWVEYLNDSTDALLFSKLENDHWSTEKTIASGQDWFVNWADFPSLVTSNDGKTIAAHWLQKSAGGTYDYDVHISQSKNEGITWSEDFIIHRDSITAEHGFVTLIPTTQNRIFATWLDGRNTKSESDESDDHGHGGAMSLRTAEFDSEGNLFEAFELDSKICDCCQTDAALTPNGPVVVYRDRSDEEIRDISIVRKIGNDWTQPRNISNDHWKITGCPVNGPAIAVFENQLAVAWFTAANEKPSVKVIFSKDAGNTFSEPLIIEANSPLGRVDLVLEKEKAYLSWLDEKEEEANIMLSIIDPSKASLISQDILVKTSIARKSGFPILERINNTLILAWTFVEGEETKIKTGILQLNE